MRRITERYAGHRDQYLMIGQGVFCEHPTAVSTVLGSCVAVTFYWAARRFGGVFHAMLPNRASSRADAVQGPYTFVDEAIEDMLGEFLKRGASVRQLECKVFGGASSLFQGEAPVGLKNVTVAFERLSNLGLRVSASNVGGGKGRRLLFISSTGEVYVRTLT